MHKKVDKNDAYSNLLKRLPKKIIKINNNKYCNFQTILLIITLNKRKTNIATYNVCCEFINIGIIITTTTNFQVYMHPLPIVVFINCHESLVSLRCFQVVITPIPRQPRGILISFHEPNMGHLIIRTWLSSIKVFHLLTMRMLPPKRTTKACTKNLPQGNELLLMTLQWIYMLFKQYGDCDMFKKNKLLIVPSTRFCHTIFSA